MIWCLLVLLAHVAAGQFSCGQDTSSCATNRQKNTVLEGQLPMANTSFQVVFEGAGLVGGFRTDPNGHYCILWDPDGAAGDIVLNGRESGILGSGTPLRDVPPAGCRSGDVSGGASCDLLNEPQTMLSSGRSLPRAKRSLLNGVTSTNGGWPSQRSRMISPTAGPWRKPCPEKPVAYRNRDGERASPIIALWSGETS